MRRLSFISVLIAILVGILISVQVSYEDLGNFVFDFVPAIPTETMCYYSTMFISWSTCDLIPFLRKLHLIPTYPSCKMDENDILVTVVPAKGGIVLMSRMMLEWSWRCNMCMGMVRRRFLSIFVRHSSTTFDRNYHHINPFP